MSADNKWQETRKHRRADASRAWQNFIRRYAHPEENLLYKTAMQIK